MHAPPEGASCARLTCHQATLCDAVSRIDIVANRPAAATLTLRYCVEGDIDRLLIPAPSTSRCAGELWRHTCCEAFIAADDVPGYYEFNFAPSTAWAIYRFAGYRTGMTRVEAAPGPRIDVRREEQRLTLDAVIDLASLSMLRDNGAVTLALSAVIEDSDRRLSYWALAHPLGKPDFHHPDSFVLALPPHRLTAR